MEKKKWFKDNILNIVQLIPITVGVVVAVVDELMPLADDALEECRVGSGPRAGHAEAGADAEAAAGLASVEAGAGATADAIKPTGRAICSRQA